MRDMRKDEDVQAAKEATAQSKRTLTIEQGVTPIYFLSGKFNSGFVHWVKGVDKKMRVICGGGEEGKGRAPDECPICHIVMRTYQKAKQVEKEGHEEKADKIRVQARDMSAKYEMEFVVAKGEMVYVGKNKKGKRVYKPDFDDAKVGILSLSKKQRDDLWSLAEGEKYPFIQSKNDLLTRAIKIDKAKRGDSDYATIDWIPAKETMKAPVKVDLKEFDISADYEIDKDELKKIAKQISGGGVAMSKKNKKGKKKHEVDYEDEELEDEEEDEDEDEDSDDDDNDDDEDDEDDVEEDDEDEDDDEEEEEEDDEDDDDDDDEDFLEDDEEEEKPKKSKKGKKHSKKSKEKKMKKGTGKKRGRPPKEDSEKKSKSKTGKKRGRPSKEEDAPKKGKKKRGRPVGSGKSKAKKAKF